MVTSAPESASHEGPCAVTAIVVNFNGGRDLGRCLAALCNQLPQSNILVVDNASTDDSVQRAVERWPQVRVLASDTNLGFGGGANLGAAAAADGTLLFLNPDTLVLPGCVARLHEALIGRVGVVGPMLWVGEGEVAEQGATIDVAGMPRGLVEPNPPLYVPGCCLATTKRCFDIVGGFDPRYFLFVEDVEYCWQALRRGYDVRVVATAEAYHRGGGSISGGYARGGGLEVSVTRIVLRERNTTAMFVACVPAKLLPLVAGASVLRGGAFAGLLASRGHWSGVWRLVVGLGQNVLWLPETVRRRRRPGATAVSGRAAWQRVVPGLFLWDYVHARMPVRFMDQVSGSFTGGRRGH